MGHGVPLLTCLVLAFASAWTIRAAAQTAVLLEAGDAELRSDLRWLADRGVIDVSASAWPLPLQAIREALASRKTQALSSADEDALASVERFVRRQSGLAYGVRADANTGAFPQMDFQRQARAEGMLGIYAQHATGALAGRLQANALSEPLTESQDEANLESSYLAANIGGQILYAGQLAHFWGPGNNGSLIWGNAATAIPGLGLKRATERPFETKWLSWIGPWSYELFVGEMLNYTAVPHTKIAAVRFSARPFEGFEIAGSLLEQWGGDGFDNSLDGLFTRPHSKDPNQPTNVLVSWELRYTSRYFANPITAYIQNAKEDSAGSQPSKSIVLLGAEFKHALQRARLQWYAEAADTMSQRAFGIQEHLPDHSYTHHVYTGGLYHDGLPIGHPIGGDGEIYSAGVHVVPTYSKYSVRYGARGFSAEVNPSNQPINQAFPRHAKLLGGELSGSVSLKWLYLRAALAWLHDRNSGEDDFSALLTLELPLERLAGPH